MAEHDDIAGQRPRALRWLWAARPQIDEYEAALMSYLQLSPTPGTEAYARSLIRRETALHFLLIAVRNLVKMLDKMPARYALDPDIRHAVKELRDVHEHWEKDLSRSTVRNIKKRFGAAYQPTMGWTPEEGVEIAGILRLNDLRAELDRIEGEIGPWRNPFDPG